MGNVNVFENANGFLIGNWWVFHWCPCSCRHLLLFDIICFAGLRMCLLSHMNVVFARQLDICSSFTTKFLWLLLYEWESLRLTASKRRLTHHLCMNMNSDHVWFVCIVYGMHNIFVFLANHPILLRSQLSRENKSKNFGCAAKHRQSALFFQFGCNPNGKFFFSLVETVFDDGHLVGRGYAEKFWISNLIFSIEKRRSHTEWWGHVDKKLFTFVKWKAKKRPRRRTDSSFS